MSAPSLASTLPPATASGRPRLLPPLLLTFAVILCLAPFLNKAVHIDDYLFLRSARQILAHPTDPFGTTINWYDTEMPLADVTQNPPGVSYVLAASGALFGWSETALHLVFVLPALAAVLGTYVLARRFCSQPVLAAGLALVSPVFWVSATTLMSDVPMLALWLWSVELWLRGLEHRANRWLAASAVLATLAALTKYFGAALIPLLLAYTVFRDRRPSWKLLWLLLPLLALFAYEKATALRYGHGMLTAAGHYAQTRDKPGSVWQRGLITLSFAGGCLLPVLFLAPRLWPRRWLAAGALFGLGLVATLPLADRLGVCELHPDGTTQWSIIVQVAVFALGGLLLLALALQDLRTHRDGDALLLALWFGGTLVFAGAFNWTVSGRTILPLAPVVAILLVRRLQRCTPSTTARAAWLRLWPLLPAVALAAAVVHADAALADRSRLAARTLHEQLGNRSATLWFQGHWGFQYYMEAVGASPLDKQVIVAMPGDYLVSPEDNTNISGLSPSIFADVGDIQIEVSGLVVTMHIPAGAGFYSDSWGPLPFAFAALPPQRFTVARFQNPPWAR